MTPKEWLIDWFNKNSNVERDIVSHSSQGYLENGWIDSIQFISLVTDIEEFFKITFSNDEFEHEEFGTLDGLAKIIKLKQND